MRILKIMVKMVVMDMWMGFGGEGVFGDGKNVICFVEQF